MSGCKMKFEDLDVWKRGARLSANIYKKLAQTKDFGFKDQITRSGLSIPSNIAEGIERESNKDCVRFLQYAKGSCGELRTQIYIGIDIGYINDAIGKKMDPGNQRIISHAGWLNQIKAKCLSKN